MVRFSGKLLAPDGKQYDSDQLMRMPLKSVFKLLDLADVADSGMYKDHMSLKRSRSYSRQSRRPSRASRASRASRESRRRRRSRSTSYSQRRRRYDPYDYAYWWGRPYYLNSGSSSSGSSSSSSSTARRMTPKKNRYAGCTHHSECGTGLCQDGICVSMVGDVAGSKADVFGSLVNRISSGEGI